MTQPKELDLCTLIETFGSEEKCRAYLEALRWPTGIYCPSCYHQRVSRIYDRHQFDCDSCRYQFSATAGTIFHDTHLPLWKWFLATYLLCESRKGMSANQMKRMLKVSYKTAWYLCHRIRAAMIETGKAKLTGTDEVAETYVGGKKQGIGQRRAKAEKEVVIGIRQRGGDLRFFHAEDARTGTLAKYIRENISKDVEVVMTDDAPAYIKAVGNRPQKAINHSKHVYVMGDIHTNTIESAFSLLRRGIMRTWRKVSAKHLAAYLDEMTFRFNNRKTPFLFRDTMFKLIESPTLEYKKLIEVA